MDQLTSTAVTEKGKVAFQIRQKYLPNISQIRILHPFKGALIPYLDKTSVKSISYIFTHVYTIICTVCVVPALFLFQIKGFSKISHPINYLKFNSSVLFFYKKPAWISWKKTDITWQESKKYLNFHISVLSVFPPFMHAKIGEWIDEVRGCQDIRSVQTT